ncbi:hypothetical protein SIM91_18710 [Rhodococcus opacus]|uniref:hypothetical protein n=1 Tax=Rhodococcus opacus TaxID=37919 RepID=UPI0002A3D0B4|nr:hypothetical protein [Rhodococcus opacus]ELB87900.1 hypothetical protein Rwratislav_37437 [Rhodococcus wratislaviensis IFP 2016]MDX5965294.1 hypothetical protein [Rhodococcus opacus]NKY76676.1 hypothetical protein [Rhodococcus opacus]
MIGRGAMLHIPDDLTRRRYQAIWTSLGTLRHYAVTVIQMKAVDARYHRHSRFDEQVEFIYRVLPPA